MKIKSTFNGSFDDIDGVCIAIGRPDSQGEQQHIGLLFIDADGQVKFLHLAWHYRLQKDLPSNHYLWLDTFLDPINKIHLATFCAAIFESNKTGIPYGLSIDGTGFDTEGHFITAEPHLGLTCATFVIQVFHSQGFFIIDFEKWPCREDDGVWQSAILEILDSHAAAEYMSVQRQKIQQGAARFRPEEVAAAAALPNSPQGLDTLKESAKKILDSIILHIQQISKANSAS